MIDKKDLLPEEVVRQKLLCKMIGLGYPRGFLSVEQELELLPHLKNEKNLPKRRVDIICFAKGIDPHFELYPLLLIECKSKSIKGAKEQVLGYNRFVGAYFVAIANEKGVKLFWSSKNRDNFVNFLPTYKQLIDAIKDR